MRLTALVLTLCVAVAFVFMIITPVSAPPPSPPRPPTQQSQDYNNHAEFQKAHPESCLTVSPFGGYTDYYGRPCTP
jgi:hypothetical protein